MSEARIDSLSNESNTGGPTLSGITTFSGTNYFVPPVGTTAERPENPQKGSIRFNTDTKKLEYFRGNTIGWSDIEASNHELGGGTGSNAGTGTRGIYGGYHVSGTTIEYITLSTLGNSENFGNLSHGRYQASQNCCNETRMIWGGGYDGGGWEDTIDYVTVATKGDAIDFGNLSLARLQVQTVNSKTRGIFGGGQKAPNHSGSNILDYVTIASAGHAKDFGDLNMEKAPSASASSSTRGIIQYYSGAGPGTMEYITMASQGNATHFGKLATLNGIYGGGSSATRAVFGGGYITNVMQYITMASEGDSIDFGDLTVAKFNNRAFSSPTRAVFGGGLTTPGSTKTNLMDYVEIATTGNAVSFGEMALMTNQQNTSGNSNGHGGLSG